MQVTDDGLTAPPAVAIVEDHAALREGLKLMLRRFGYPLTGAASDVRGGHALIQRSRPDVAIIDLTLPDGSGADLTRRLLDESPDLRVLMYTGFEDEHRVGEALASGALGLASKAGSSVELRAAIDAVASGEHYLDPRFVFDEPPATAARQQLLTAREREVMALLARGLSGDEIGEQLDVSRETVRTHVRNAMERLGARTRAHAIVKAWEHGELPLPVARRRDLQGASGT
jgi:DNA-binding NarL/FixJ family response regulator